MAKTILIADDNPRIREQIRLLLRSEVCYEVCAEAANGKEAIELAVRHRPDLIVLDLSMPTLTGFDAAREIKKLMPAVPIILFTQHADLGKPLIGTVACVDSVVSKSEPLELIRQVRALLPV